MTNNPVSKTPIRPLITVGFYHDPFEFARAPRRSEPVLRGLHVVAPAQLHDQRRLSIHGETEEIHVREGMIGAETGGMDDGGELGCASRLVMPLPVKAGKTMGEPVLQYVAHTVGTPKASSGCSRCAREIEHGFYQIVASLDRWIGSAV